MAIGHVVVYNARAAGRGPASNTRMATCQVDCSCMTTRLIHILIKGVVHTSLPAPSKLLLHGKFLNKENVHSMTILKIFISSEYILKYYNNFL